MPTPDVDVAIVGARVAGAVLAAHLGERGHSVLLLDRAEFPSPTLSTHYFRGAGMVGVLAELGVLDDVLELGSPPLLRRVIDVHGEVVQDEPIELPGDVGYSLSVRRESLDALLIRHAVRFPTVSFRSRATVTELAFERSRVTGLRFRDGRGDHDVRARLVVGADGRHSLVARQVQARDEASTPPMRAIYYQYFEGFPSRPGADRHAAEFSFVGNELAYVFPSDGGATCVPLSVDLEAFRRIKGDHERGYRERLRDHPQLADRIEAATPLGPVLACGPERNWVRVPWGPGWALVGDAGLHQDPWSGRGMDMASGHALLLADALDDLLTGGASESEALTRYHQKRNEHAREIYDTTVRFGHDLRELLSA